MAAPNRKRSWHLPALFAEGHNVTPIATTSSG
jgi:hypothetical protein